jgi:hypothetical protein
VPLKGLEPLLISTVEVQVITKDPIRKENNTWIPGNCKKDLAKNRKTQSGPPPSPSRSNELGMLQPWTSTGTTPLVFFPAEPSATNLRKGLPAEVETSPENLTGLNGQFQAKDFGKSIRIA